MNNGHRMKYPNGRRSPRTKYANGSITVQWGHEPDDANQLLYYWRNSDEDQENGRSARRDTRILMAHFEEMENTNGRNLKEELITRGYDISTFKFTIERLKP